MPDEINPMRWIISVKQYDTDYHTHIESSWSVGLTGVRKGSVMDFKSEKFIETADDLKETGRYCWLRFEVPRWLAEYLAPVMWGRRLNPSRNNST